MQDYISMASLAAGVVVWALRLEGRVNTQDKLNESIKESIASEFRNLNERLGRIESAVIERGIGPRP